MIMQKKRSAICFSLNSSEFGTKKPRNCCAPWVPPEPSKQRINDAQKMGASRRRLPSAGCFFSLWASLLDDSRGKKERREVWEEAEAILIVKTTPLKYHGKGSKTAVSSVLCGSALSFLVRHYCSNNILVFGALFTYSCCSILYSFLLPLQWLITLVINASDWGEKEIRVCSILRKCKFMFIFTLVSYILNTYGDWMILVFICMDYG